MADYPQLPSLFKALLKSKQSVSIIYYLTESPSKKSRLDAEEAVFDESAESKMDVEESSGDIQKNEDQEMDIERDSFKVTDLPNIHKGLYYNQ